MFISDLAGFHFGQKVGDIQRYRALGREPLAHSSFIDAGREGGDIKASGPKQLKAGVGQLREGPNVDRFAKMATIGAASQMTKSSRSQSRALAVFLTRLSMVSRHLTRLSISPLSSSGAGIGSLPTGAAASCSNFEDLVMPVSISR